MLTAQTKTGKKICLGFDYKKEVLQSLRHQEEFLCPVCGEAVILKLGEKRIFHFAHKSGGICHDNYERESDYHMDGKRQLFQWLVTQGIPAELEYYIKEIQQRPDIMFIHNGKKYALEYQCSTIPEEVFLKRTNAYIQNGYIPLWILGGKHIQVKKRDIIEFSNFHYLFLRETPDGNYFIPTYDPEKKSFHFIGSILSYSAKNTFVQNYNFPLKSLKLDDLLSPKRFGDISIERWYAELERYFLNWSLHPSPHQQHFLHEIYSKNLNPYLLPAEIGLPVPNSFLIHTSPILWQTYFYLDVLAGKQPGAHFHFSEVERSFKRRISRNEIIVRSLPHLEQVTPITAEINYLFQLKELGLLERKGKFIYQIKLRITIPRSNREKEENKQLFFEKYHRIHTKQ